MSTINLPIAFGGLLAAAVIIKYGLDNAKTAVAAAPAATSSGTASPSSPSAGVTPNTTGGINPVPGAIKNRIDEGGDYTLSSAGFLAPWKSKIVATTGSFFRGGTIVAQLLDGPYAGSYYYVAEGVAPASGIAVGKIVQAGTQIATPIQSPYGVGPAWFGSIEAGFSDANGIPLAQSTGGYSEGQTTAAGVAWNDLVTALGGVADTVETAVRGSLSGLSRGQY